MDSRWIDERTNNWMDGCKDEWMDGWRDRWTDRMVGESANVELACHIKSCVILKYETVVSSMGPVDHTWGQKFSHHCHS